MKVWTPQHRTGSFQTFFAHISITVSSRKKLIIFKISQNKIANQNGPVHFFTPIKGYRNMEVLKGWGGLLCLYRIRGIKFYFCDFIHTNKYVWKKVEDEVEVLDYFYNAEAIQNRKKMRLYSGIYKEENLQKRGKVGTFICSRNSFFCRSNYKSGNFHSEKLRGFEHLSSYLWNSCIVWTF